MSVLLIGWTSRYLLSSKSQSPAVDQRLLSGGITAGKSSSATLLPVRLQWGTTYHFCQALVDSGAEGNFMDIQFASQLRLPVVPLAHPISVNALNGQALPTITHTTNFLTLITAVIILRRHSSCSFPHLLLWLSWVILGWSAMALTSTGYLALCFPGVIIVMMLVLSLPVRLCLVLFYRRSR